MSAFSIEDCLKCADDIVKRLHELEMDMATVTCVLAIASSMAQLDVEDAKKKVNKNAD